MSTRSVDIRDAEIGGEPETDTGAVAPAPIEKPPAQADRLEHEIEQIRDHLGGLVTELDHRRHRLGARAMLKRYRWPLAIGGMVLLGAAIGGMAWRRASGDRARAPLHRGKRLRAGLARAIDNPDAVAVKQPNVGIKILTAAATAAAAVAARRLASRFLARSS